MEEGAIMAVGFRNAASRRPRFGPAGSRARVLAAVVTVSAAASVAAELERIGAVLATDGQGVYVTDVVPGSPATRCASSVVGDAATESLRPGDRILSIDGIDPAHHEAAAARIRSGGTVVQIVVKQPATGTIRSLNICRNGATTSPERHLSTHDRIVWALLVADTADQDIGTGCIASLARMEHLLLSSGIPLNRIAVSHQYNASFTPDRLRSAIQRIGALARPQDTFVVYVNGHGAVDPILVARARELARKRGNPLPDSFYWGAHVKMRGGDLLREQAFILLRKQPARLKVFITDTCLSVARVGRISHNDEQSGGGGDERESGEGKVRICRTEERVGVSRLETLLLHSVGDVDFAACGFGQKSRTVAPDWNTVRRMNPAEWNRFLMTSGAFFTSSLCEVLIREPTVGDVGYGWRNWFEDAKGRTTRVDAEARRPGEQREIQVPILRSIKGCGGDGTLPPTRRWVVDDGMPDV